MELLFAVGVGSVTRLEEDFPFDIENQTSGTIILKTTMELVMLESHFGSRGLTKTQNDNGIWDVCEIFEITITEVPEVNQEWDEDL